MSEKEVARLTDRCIHLESENHKLWLQTLALRVVVERCIKANSLQDKDRDEILELFSLTGGFTSTTETDTKQEGICDVCFKKGPVHACENCKQATFCSVQCEVAALKTHFEFCKAWRSQMEVTSICKVCK